MHLVSSAGIQTSDFLIINLLPYPQDPCSRPVLIVFGTIIIRNWKAWAVYVFPLPHLPLYVLGHVKKLYIPAGCGEDDLRDGQAVPRNLASAATFASRLEIRRCHSWQEEVCGLVSRTSTPDGTAVPRPRHVQWDWTASRLRHPRIRMAHRNPMRVTLWQNNRCSGSVSIFLTFYDGNLLL